MYGERKESIIIRTRKDKPVIAPEFFDTRFQIYGREPGFLLLS